MSTATTMSAMSTPCPIRRPPGPRLHHPSRRGLQRPDPCARPREDPRDRRADDRHAPFMVVVSGTRVSNSARGGGFGRSLRAALSVAIVAARRFPPRSLTPPRASSLRAVACQEGGTVRASMAEGVPGGTAEGAVPRTNKHASDVMTYFPTRAHCANPASGGVLRSAPLRCGRDSE